MWWCMNLPVATGPASIAANVKQLAELSLWMRDHLTPEDVVVAGPMVSSAIHVTLATQWPTRPGIALHPHAENPEMRGRYRQYYQVFGRVPESVVYMATQPFNATYLVCAHHSSGATSACAVTRVLGVMGTQVVDFVPCDAKCVGGFTYADIAGHGSEFARDQWAQHFNSTHSGEDAKAAALYDKKLKTWRNAITKV